MYTLLKNILQTCLPLLFITSCQRELNWENNNTTLPAVFSFITSGDSCSGVVLKGTYAAGAVMNDSNTITLSVNVSRAGTYKIESTTANGIAFSDSGSFANTGVQQIILKGKGTASAAGNFSFSSGNGGCSFYILFAGSSGSSNALYSMDGAPGVCTQYTVSGTYSAGAILDPAANKVTARVNVTRAGSYTVSSAAINGIQFSASGSFTSTGLQTITLTGSGTPIAEGDYDYTVGNVPGSCSFTITVNPAGPPAVGLFLCNTITVNGMYKRGQALNNSNTIVIPVTVTTEGYYSLSTGYINGCEFTGSGFLPVGDQVITLTGSGIPPDSGSFSFPVSFSGNSCAINIHFDDGVFSDYLVCDINGVERTFNAELTGNDAVIFTGLNSISIVGKPTIGASEYFSITINSIQAITAGPFLQGTTGVKFSTTFHKDPANVFWQPSDFSNPRFKVIINYVSALRIEGTFSGQYFDLNGSGSNSKQITAGRFSVAIQ